MALRAPPFLSFSMEKVVEDGVYGLTFCSHAKLCRITELCHRKHSKNGYSNLGSGYPEYAVTLGLQVFEITRLAIF